MATPFMKRSHAVVWLPPRAVGERAFANEARLLVMRMRERGEAGVSCERMSLDALPRLKTVSLVFDARDVTLIAAQVPALSPAKLLKALPNVVEDLLLTDAPSCALALGPALADGRRVVAAIDRGWLDFTIGAFERRGLAVTGAWPAQLVLPAPADGWAMVCVNDGIGVRTGDAEGFGWGASSDPDFRAEAIAAAAGQAIEGERPAGELIVYAETQAWREPVERALERMSIAHRLVGLPLPRAAPVELLDARSGSAGRRWLSGIDWRAWRPALGLAAACVLAWLVGINLHWATLARERDALKTQAEQRFRQAFPNTPVIVDPLLQMQRTVSDLRTRTGQPGPEDFVPMLGRFAQALGPRGHDALASVEYRDNALKVRFQPTAVEGRSARDALREACQRQGLQLAFDNEREPTATVSTRR